MVVRRTISPDTKLLAKGADLNTEYILWFVPSLLLSLYHRHMPNDVWAMSWTQLQNVLIL